MWKTEAALPAGATPIKAAGVAALLGLLVAAPLAAGAATPPDRHLGVATCASTTCHGSAKPAEKDTIQHNEYVTWSRFDPHAGAWRTLLDERSVVMARRLGIGNAHEARICLDCHTDNAPVAERGPKFQLDDGIGCEACHGGAERWLASHDDVPAVSHADNLANGMRAIDEPRVRAGVCLACHVGDSTADRKDRFASHRLMAAGHPRLSFELDTFTELWRTSGGREHYIRDADYAERKPAVPTTQTWATGLVAGSRAQVRLVSQHYAGDGTLPDFALFNCYSCHRAMRLRDWQDKGRDAGAEPGRLRFEDSVMTMLQAALAARPESRAMLGREVAAFQNAAGAGGDTVKRAAAALDAALEDIERELSARPLGRAESRQALDALARGAGRGDYPDYVSAEQAAMGIAVLMAEAGSLSGNRKPIDALFRALENDERYDPRRFGRILQSLRPTP
jgi:hypothetical protein